MKRLIATAMVVVMTMLLMAGCGKSTDSETATDSTTQAGTETGTTTESTEESLEGSWYQQNLRRFQFS